MLTKWIKETFFKLSYEEQCAVDLIRSAKDIHEIRVTGNWRIERIEQNKVTESDQPRTLGKAGL